MILDFPVDIHGVSGGFLQQGVDSRPQLPPYTTIAYISGTPSKGKEVIQKQRGKEKSNQKKESYSGFDFPLSYGLMHLLFLFFFFSCCLFLFLYSKPDIATIMYIILFFL